MIGARSYAAAVTSSQDDVWVNGGWRLKKLDGEERQEACLSDPTTRWRTGLSGGHGGRSVIFGGSINGGHQQQPPAVWRKL